MEGLPNAYRNQVICGDVMETLAQLPDRCVDMVFGDPDYNVGITYAGRRFTKSWEEYITWYCALARESLRVLKPDGNLFMLNYPRQNAYLRVRCLDELAHGVQEYVWVYNTNVGHSPRRLTTAHRSILHATKSARNRFFKAQVAQPYQNPDDRRIRGRLAEGSPGRMPYSWLHFNLVKNVSRQKTVHACQIPEGLSELLIQAATGVGDSVFVLFGGSGSEVCLAERLGRVFLACEIHPQYHRLIQERLAHGGEIPQSLRHPASALRKGAAGRLPASSVAAAPSGGE